LDDVENGGDSIQRPYRLPGLLGLFGNIDYKDLEVRRAAGEG
jgi:hypothetical protein